MGRVHRGVDEVTSAVVAIKLMTAAGWDDDARRRFQREGRALCALDHPAILRCLAVGDDDGRPYLVTEFIEGRTLEDDLRHHGRPDLPTFHRRAAELCAALAHAHDRGILHRDVKASNVMVLDDGTLRLVDFGLARPVEGATAITRTGVFIGTPDYLAPETILGEKLTAASDVYSTGVLFFELLAGRRPFTAPRLVDMVKAHTSTAPPSLAALRPDLPSSLVAVVERCLAKRPDERFASFKALAEALALTREGPSIAPAVDFARTTRAAGAARDGTAARSAPAERPAPAAAKRRPAVIALTGLCLLLFAVCLVPGPRPAPPSVVARTVGPVSAAVAWQGVDEAMDYEVWRDESVVMRGVAEARGTTATVELRGLNPSTAYVLVVRGAFGEYRDDVVTSALAPTGTPRSWLLKKAFCLDYRTNAPDDCRLEVVTADGVRRAATGLPGSGRAVVEDVPATAATVDWKLSYRAIPVAGGTTERGPRLFSLANNGEPYSDFSVERGMTCGPVWHDDHLYVATFDGLVHALTVDERAGASTVTAWIFGSANRAVIGRPRCNTAGLTVLDDGRLFLITAFVNGRTEAWCLDGARRSAEWRRRTAGMDPTAVPAFVLDGRDEWNGPLGSTEWHADYGFAWLAPQAAGIVVDGLVAVPAAIGAAAAGWMWVDGRDGRLIGTSPFTAAEVAVAPHLPDGRRPDAPSAAGNFWTFADTLRHGGWLATVFCACGRPSGSASEFVLVACPEARSGLVPRPRVVCSYSTNSRRQAPFGEGGNVWLTYERGLFRWTVGSTEAPEVFTVPPSLGEGDILSPVVVSGSRLLFCWSTSVAQSTIVRDKLRPVSLCSALPVAGRLTDLRRYGPSILEEPDDFSGHILHFRPWSGGFAGTGRTLLFAVDGSTRRSGYIAPALRHIAGWSIRSDGLVAAVNDRHGIFVAPSDLIQLCSGQTLTAR